MTYMKGQLDIRTREDKVNIEGNFERVTEGPAYIYSNEHMVAC